MMGNEGPTHGKRIAQLLDESRPAVLALHHDQHMLSARVTGVGTRFGYIIAEPGMSRTLIDLAVPYAMAASNHCAGRNLKNDGYTSLSTAHALSGDAWFKAQQSLLDAEQADRIPSLLGVGMTGAIQTDRQRRGRDVCHLSLRKMHRGLLAAWEVSVELRPGLDRREQDDLCSILLLNLVLWGAELPQVALPTALHEILNSEQLVVTERGLELRPRQFGKLRSDLEQDILLEDGSVLILPCGEAKPVSFLDLAKHAFYSMSAKPATCAHREAARHMAMITGKETVINITCFNADQAKGEVELSEVFARADQFVGLHPVLVQRRRGRFIDQARHLRAECQGDIVKDELIFGVGMDTAERVVNPKFYPGENLRAILDEFAALNCRFRVSERAGSSPFEDFIDRVIPPRHRLFKELSLPCSLRGVSSTQMRRLAS